MIPKPSGILLFGSWVRLGQFSASVARDLNSLRQTSSVLSVQVSGSSGDGLGWRIWDDMGFEEKDAMLCLMVQGYKNVGPSWPDDRVLCVVRGRVPYVSMR